MPQFKVAHIKEQGVDLIIIPLPTAFDSKSPKEQKEVMAELQQRATAAKLAGTVVPVWKAGKKIKFIAPKGFHPFFKGITWAFVSQNINKELRWT